MLCPSVSAWTTMHTFTQNTYTYSDGYFNVITVDDLSHIKDSTKITYTTNQMKAPATSGVWVGELNNAAGTRFADVRIEWTVPLANTWGTGTITIYPSNWASSTGYENLYPETISGHNEMQANSSAHIYLNYAWGYLSQLDTEDDAACIAYAQCTSGVTTVYGGSGIVTPVSSFTCVPTTQQINTDVVCTDSSTNTPTDWYWTLDAEVLGTKAWKTSTSQNFTFQSAYTGFYSVNLKANNSAGSDWENKSSYVRIDSNVTQNCIGSIASGYIRTFAYIWDRSGNMIHGADISMKDVQAGAWSNYTSDADGIGCIDTLPSHTVDIYGAFTIFPNQFLPNSFLGAETGTVGNERYFVTLFPFESLASAGNTSLYVQVKDAQTKYFIPYAVVQAKVTGGATYSQSTANAGSAVFIVPNNTIIKLSASAAGYSSGSATINSGTGNVTITTIELYKGYVTATPTTTIPPGGITPAVTPDPHDPAITGSTTAKGQDMLNWLAMNGMGLVQLCFFITICALLGIKFGK